jgi:hypothetical protein
MVSFDANSKFDEFLVTLEDAKLLTLRADNSISILDRLKFVEFGYGLYLLWVHIHKRRPKIPQAYFSGIDSDHTLFLISPYNGNPHFSIPDDYLPGQFYLGNLVAHYHGNPTNCKFCDLLNSVLWNISYFKQRKAFANFLTKDCLGKISKPLTPRPDCKKCKDNLLNWVKGKILEDERFGLMFGGYPAILKTPIEPFRLLFVEPIPGDFKQTTGSFFDFFITVHIAERLGAKIYTADARMKTPFASYEIDCGIYVEKNAAKQLFVVETTSLSHTLERFKNKLLTFSALKEHGFDKMVYVYLTLGQNPSVMEEGRKPKMLAANDPDLGALHTILGSKTIEFLPLPKKFADIDSHIKSDWWDTIYLKDSYNYILRKLEDLSDPLIN